MAAKAKEVVKIQPIIMNKALIVIEGISPLMVCKWSEKATEMMEDAQAQSPDKNTKKRDAKNPWECVTNVTYWLDDKQPKEYTEEAFYAAVKAGAKTGFPLTGIKQAAASAAYRKKWTTSKMELRSTMFLSGVDAPDMMTINGSPEMRCDHVKIGMGTADLRYRPIYKEWTGSFILEYDANGGWTLENLINCLNAGGMFVGIGEWRPERDGDFGRFRVKSYGEIER